MSESIIGTLEGNVAYVRKSDGEILGHIQFLHFYPGKDEGVRVERASRNRWRNVFVPGGGHAVFDSLAEAVAWIEAHPGMPDPTKDNPNLMLLANKLVERVWTSPAGDILALHDTIHDTNTLAALHKAGTGEIEASLYRRFRPISLHRRGVRIFETEDVAEALEALAACTLGTDPSAHLRMAFEAGKSERLAIWNGLLKRLHRDPF